MRKHFLLVISILLLLSFSTISTGFAGGINGGVKDDSTTIKNPAGKKSSTAKVLFLHYLNDVYQTANLEQSGLDSAVFKKAVTGFYNLKAANYIPDNGAILTIVDYNKPSTTKRMWIVDVVNKRLLLNTWVAHGQGSGDDIAQQFSNIEDSHQSSLGFYITNETYVGKHGKSLRLDGVDEGYNDNARSRDIVLHGADYVNQNTIDELGRLGRSFGCPAVSTEVADLVIETIKNKNVMFITGNDGTYTSKYLDEEQAAKLAFADSSFNLVKDAFPIN